MRCPRCNGLEFYSHQLSSCKTCAKARAAARYAAKRDEILARTREYVKRPEVAARIQEANVAKWRAEHPEVQRVKGRSAEERAERRRRWNREWYKANPEKARTMRQREYQRNQAQYLARTSSPEGLAANRANQRRRRLGRDAVAVAYGDLLVHDPCSYCNASATGVDHIEPLIGGGLNYWTNLTGACGRCNSGKRDTPLLLFLVRR